MLIAASVACTGREGPAGPAGPAGPGTPALVTANGTASLVLDESTFGFTRLPGLSISVTIPPGTVSDVLLETDGGIQLASADPAAQCFTDVALFVDGVQVGPGRRVTVSNTSSVLYAVGTYGFSVQTSLTSGTHPIAVMAKPFTPSVAPCHISSDASGSALPGHPHLQAVLNVVAFF